MSFKEKYLKYKSKYLQLKTIFLKGGASLFSDDTIIESIIQTCSSNMRENIRDIGVTLTSLTQDQIGRLNIDRLSEDNKLGQGQFGVVYDLSPNYAIKKVSIIQSGRDKSKYINKEIRANYFVEYLNRTIPLYSGNVAHFFDREYSYMIMKKYKNINELESSVFVNDNINDLDVAISLISQLYIIVKYAASKSLNHGDEKFDNLLFEIWCSEDTPNFTYKIDNTTYKVKNCGFKLRLIDWGESDEVTNMGPNWNSAWIENINLGISGEKKSAVNYGAPTSDYLVRMCKIMGVLGLNKKADDFEAYYPTINRIVDGNEAEIERIKLSVILGEEGKDTIMNKFDTKNIENIFSKLKELYDTKDNNFLNFTDIVQPKDVDLNLLPNFSFKSTRGNCTPGQPTKGKIVMEYCTPVYPQPTKVSYYNFVTNIDNYTNRKRYSDGVTLIEDQQCKPILESATPGYYIIKNIEYNKIGIVRDKLEELFGGRITFKQKVGKKDIYINDKNLFITEKYDDDLQLYIYNISITQGIIVDINNLKGRVISTNNRFIELFKFIKDAINRSGNKIVMFPLGFFHLHLSYNNKLNKFFCIIHAKFEVSSELGEQHQGVDRYLKKIVEYKDKPRTCIDLTEGTKEENILNHNYICEINNDNTVNIYKMKCIPNNAIIITGSFPIDDRFFNVPSFADLNYYGESKIGLKTEYVIINKRGGNLKEKGYKKNDHNDFYKKSVPYCLPVVGPASSQNIWTDEEIAEVQSKGININQYKQYRGLQVSHKDAMDYLKT
jgi:hypothetical protein